MAELTPVDHDPFAASAAPSTGAGLTKVDYDPFAAPATKPKLQRTWGEAVTDTAKDVGAGFGGLLQSGGDLYGLATGDMDNFAAREGRGMRQFYQEGQSEALKGKRAERSAAIDATDGVLGKAGTAIKATLTNPALLGSVIAENAATLIPAAAVGRLAKGATGARALLKGATAEQAALQAGRVGTGAAIGTAAVQQGTDVAGGVYDQSLAKDEATWAGNPEYQQRVAAGEAPDAVRHDLALSAARGAFPAAAAISAVSQAIPGGATLERALVGGAARATLTRPGIAGRAIGAVRGALGEGTQEAIEEGGGQFAGNVAERAYVDPNTDLSEGVGENAGMGFAGALGLGGGAGIAHTPQLARPRAKPGSLTEVADELAASAPKPVLALPAPMMLGRADGRVATESQKFAADQKRTDRDVSFAGAREQLGLTPDINAARLRHPAAAPNAPRLATSQAQPEAELRATGAGLRVQIPERSMLRPPETLAGPHADAPDGSEAAPSNQIEKPEVAPMQLGSRAAPPPANLDPSTNELFDIDVETWPNAAEHQQPRAIIAALTAEGMANKRRPPGVTRISETYNVGKDTARSLRSQAVKAMTAASLPSVSSVDASANEPASSASAAPQQPAAADAAPAARAALDPAQADREAVAGGEEAAASASPPVEIRGQDTPTATEQLVAEQSSEPFTTADAAVPFGQAATSRQEAEESEAAASAAGMPERSVRTPTTDAGMPERSVRTPTTEGSSTAHAASESAAAPATESLAPADPAPTPRREESSAVATADEAGKRQAVAQPQAAPASGAVQAKTRVKQGKRSYVESAPETLQAYFQPDRVINGYGGLDRVVAFNPPKDDQSWSVRVIRVDKNGQPEKNEVERNHSTLPDQRELVKVLGKAEKPVPKRLRKVAQSAAPASEQVQSMPNPAETQGNSAAEGGLVSGDSSTDQAARVEAAAAEAATSPTNEHPEPTDAQKEAGNYRKGKARIAGLDISIENPRGSRRRPEWKPLAHHYGYFRNSVARDKDHVDVFLTDHASDPARPVFVIDQVDKHGKYDEAKVVMGAADEAEARKAYLDNYQKGWTGLGAITSMPLDEFKSWVQDKAKTQRPLGKLANSASKDANSAPENAKSGQNSARPPRETAKTARTSAPAGGSENVQGIANPGADVDGRNRSAAARDEAFDRVPPKSGFSRQDLNTGPRDSGLPASASLDFDRALQLKRDLTAKWGDNAPNVILVQDAEGFPDEAKVDPGYRRGEGFYNGKPTVWINVGGIATEQRFGQVLAHEALGHYGVEQVIGAKDWDGIVDAIARHDRNSTGAASVRAAIADVHRRYGSLDRTTFAKEVIAVMAEQGARNGLVDRVIAAVRRYLRKVMPTLAWSDADVRDLLGQADSFLRAGRTNEDARAAVQATAFSRTSKEEPRRSIKTASDAERANIGGSAGAISSLPLDAGSANQEGRFSQSPVQMKVDAAGQRSVEMGGETFVDRGGQFYMTNGTGHPKDFTTLGAASDAARLTGGEVLADTPVEGERPTWSVVAPATVIRGAKAAAPGMFSKSALPAYLSDAQRAALGKISTFADAAPLQDQVRAWSMRWQEKLIQGVFDQFAPLKSLDETAYMQARLSKGTDGAVEAAFRYGPPKLTDGALDITPDGQGLQGFLRELGGEHDLFFAWLAGNRSRRLMREGREHLFTEPEITALTRLHLGKMADGRGRSAVYEKAHRAFNRYQKAVLDVAEQAGMVDAEHRARWEHEFYVPFYRVMEQEPAAGFAAIDGLAGQKAYEQLKGGDEQLGDLLANTLSNWSHLLSASMKNMAASRALQAATKIGVATPVDAAGRGTVSVSIKGQPKHYTLSDPLVFDALTMLHHPQWENPAMKGMRWFKRALTTGVTADPSFRIRNLMRDTISALATNRVGYNPLRNLVDGWQATKAGSETQMRLLGGGGAIRFGTLLDGDQAASAKRLIASGVKDVQILDSRDKVKAAFGKIWDHWQEIGDRAETVNRAVAYQQARAEGKTHLEASLAARDLLDFTMGGKWAAVRFLTQIVPFLNARLQGMYKLGRAAKADPRRFGAVTGAVAMASVLLHLLNADDDEYRALPDWVRDTYWWVRLPGVDNAVYIPKPFEIGALGSVVERGAELMTGGDDYQARDFADTLIGILGNQLAMNPIPQAVRPAMEAAFNRNTFQDRPIDSLGQERLPGSDRYTARTSAGAIALGRALDYSPQRIEHLVRGYFGWLGMQALNVSDLAGRSLFDMPSNPGHNLSKIGNTPVLGSFVRPTASGGNKYLTRFYDQQKAVDQIYAAYSEARKAGDLERVRELAGRDELRLRPIYAATNQLLQKMNQRIRKVTNDRTMSARAKGELLDGLYETRNRVAKRATRRARAVEDR